MCHSSIRIFKLLSCIILVFLSTNALLAQNIEGFVFEDSNHNSIMDSDEKGLSGVMVSNQKEVVITDENGYFKLKLIEGNYIFVTKPEAYQFQLNEFNNPEFYFLYKTKKTNEEFRFPRMELTTKIPKVLYFPLYKNEGEEEHSCLLIGDPQMKDDRRLAYYRDGVIPFLAKRNADFYVVLGDMANNFLGILPKEKSISSTLGIPGYRVFGNHDMNYKATENKNAAETFKSVYGPDFYSFDYGRFHYVILNDVLYDGWQTDLFIAGKYAGGLTKNQLKWLANDLQFIPSDKTIVFFSHIPLHEIFIEKKTMRLFFEMLKDRQRIFAVSGHLHTIIAYDYTAEDGWEFGSGFEGLVAGATCGSWWSGPLDKNNIPYSLANDGSPKGFFQMHTKNADFNYVFHSTNEPFDLQMRTYVVEDEIWVNWFVGKSTDTVSIYIDDNPQALILANFLDRDPLVLSNFKKENELGADIERVERTAHLWKVKIPEELNSGYHSIKVVAKDSRGQLFTGKKIFYLNK